MKQKKNDKRNVNGILLLDKPEGITSNRALQIVKRIFFAAKAGHTGSLDPLASGMLPLCFGEATKLSQYLLTADKTYQVTAQLGIRTTTGDKEGEILSEKPVPKFSVEQIDHFFNQFRGNIEQIPSMFSALKHKGQPLYKLARQGIDIPREKRQLTVFSLKVLSVVENNIQFTLHCSKGTYVRTLVDDFGEVLGCGAHVIELRRLSVGTFESHQMVDLETLENLPESELNKYLLPSTLAILHWPELILPESSLFYLRQGNPIVVAHAPTSGWVRLMDKQGQFIAIGEVMPDGKIAPRRIFSQNSSVKNYETIAC